MYKLLNNGYCNIETYIQCINFNCLTTEKKCYKRFTNVEGFAYVCLSKIQEKDRIDLRMQ